MQSRTWNGYSFVFSTKPPLWLINLCGLNSSGFCHIPGSLLIAQCRGRTMVPAGNVHGPTLVTLTVPWGTPRGVTGRSLWTSSIVALRRGSWFASEGGSDPHSLSISSWIFSWISLNSADAMNNMAHMTVLREVSIPAPKRSAWR